METWLIRSQRLKLLLQTCGVLDCGIENPLVIHKALLVAQVQTLLHLAYSFTPLHRVVVRVALLLLVNGDLSGRATGLACRLVTSGLGVTLLMSRQGSLVDFRQCGNTLRHLHHVGLPHLRQHLLHLIQELDLLQGLRMVRCLCEVFVARLKGLLLVRVARLA